MLAMCISACTVYSVLLVESLHVRMCRSVHKISLDLFPVAMFYFSRAVSLPSTFYIKKKKKDLIFKRKMGLWQRSNSKKRTLQPPKETSSDRVVEAYAFAPLSCTRHFSISIHRPSQATSRYSSPLLISSSSCHSRHSPLLQWLLKNYQCHRPKTKKYSTGTLEGSTRGEEVTDATDQKPKSNPARTSYAPFVSIRSTDSTPGTRPRTGEQRSDSGCLGGSERISAGLVCGLN